MLNIIISKGPFLKQSGSFVTIFDKMGHLVKKKDMLFLMLFDSVVLLVIMIFLSYLYRVALKSSGRSYSSTQ